MRCVECGHKRATHGDVCGRCAVTVPFGVLVTMTGGVLVLCYTGLLFGLWS